MLAACAAPAIVKAEILMPVRPVVVVPYPETGMVDITTSITDYINDAADALNDAAMDQLTTGTGAYVAFMHPMMKDYIKELQDYGTLRKQLGFKPLYDVCVQRELPRFERVDPFNFYPDPADPLGQRGYIKSTHEIKRVEMNESWMTSQPAPQPKLTRKMLDRAIKQLDAQRAPRAIDIGRERYNAIMGGNDWPVLD